MRTYLNDQELILILGRQLLSLVHRSLSENATHLVLLVIQRDVQHPLTLDEGHHGQQLYDDAQVLTAVSIDDDEVTDLQVGGCSGVQDVVAILTLQLHL